MYYAYNTPDMINVVVAGFMARKSRPRSAASLLVISTSFYNKFCMKNHFVALLLWLTSSTN